MQSIWTSENREGAYVMIHGIGATLKTVGKIADAVVKTGDGIANLNGVADTNGGTELVGKIAGAAKDVSNKAKSEAKNLPNKMEGTTEANELSEELEFEEPENDMSTVKNEVDGLPDEMDFSNDDHTEEATDTKELPQKMEPPVVIKFTCPEGMDRKEFIRQIKGQERGLNSQSVAQNMENREAYQTRKAETGNGRALEGAEAQRIVREKAYQNRIATNIKDGMSYSEAKEEASGWIKTQAALHNPDQIAGGNPTKVSRMGDANVNSSIGSQWRARVEQLDSACKEFAENYTKEELSQIKMNVKLEVE